ncbi:MAG: DUF4169 family protein [Pseudomonadota bacterium]
MSAEIINLRQARKRLKRETDSSAAAENRSRYGRSKTDREQAAQDAKRAKDHLDRHRRDDQGDDTET